MAYIEFKDVTRVYGSDGSEVHALDGASFEVERGELAVILGASGAGKTTALNILGGMDGATSGRVVVDGRDVSSASEDDLVEYRRADVGFVFQFYNLVPNLRRDGITVLIITHNSALAPMADRLIRFKSGRVTDMQVNEHPVPIADIEW